MTGVFAWVTKNAWISLKAAADHLGEHEESLKKKLQRASKKGPDGVREANLSGLKARKLGALWKIRLEGWS